MASEHEYIEYGLSDVRELFNSEILTGVIVSVDKGEDTASVDITNYGLTNNVPIFYHCPNKTTVEGGSSAFIDGDSVLVLKKESDFKVIGFTDGLKPCTFNVYIRPTIDGKFLTHGGQNFYLTFLDVDGNEVRTQERNLISGEDITHYGFAGPFDMTKWDQESSVKVWLKSDKTNSDNGKTIMFDYYQNFNEEKDDPLWRQILWGVYRKYAYGPSPTPLNTREIGGGPDQNIGQSNNYWSLYDFRQIVGTENSYEELTEWTYEQTPDNEGNRDVWNKNVKLKDNIKYVSAIPKEFTADAFLNSIRIELNIWNSTKNELEYDANVAVFNLDYGLKGSRKKYYPEAEIFDYTRYYLPVGSFNTNEEVDVASQQMPPVLILEVDAEPYSTSSHYHYKTASSYLLDPALDMGYLSNLWVEEGENPLYTPEPIYWTYNYTFPIIDRGAFNPDANEIPGYIVIVNDDFEITETPSSVNISAILTFYGTETFEYRWNEVAEEWVLINTISNNYADEIYEWSVEMIDLPDDYY